MHCGILICKRPSKIFYLRFLHRPISYRYIRGIDECTCEQIAISLYISILCLWFTYIFTCFLACLMPKNSRLSLAAIIALMFRTIDSTASAILLWCVLPLRGIQCLYEWYLHRDQCEDLKIWHRATNEMNYLSDIEDYVLYNMMKCMQSRRYTYTTTLE